MALGEVVGGRFTLEALAGAGAMGEVYRAADRRSGGRVAVKVMPGRQSDDAARFVREARILAELTHPHIVSYVDHGATAAGAPWLAMEWLEGEDLAARLARGPLGLGDSVRLGVVMAEALGFVHARGIVHRDLKPSNVFLVDREVSRGKLLDFGVARLEAAERMTRKGMLLGTPGYMAPEQVNGAANIDARADVFALGCMLFECLTGEPLFTGSSILAILAKIALAPPPRLRDRLPGVPWQLEQLLASALAKDPAARPANGREVAEALRALGELEAGVLDADATLEAQARPSQGALAESEQRAVAVILVGTGGGGGAGLGTAATDRPATLDPATELELEAEATMYGGRVVRLVNGALAVELSGPGLATDLAAQAARCALALRGYLAGRPIAVALGRADATGALLHGPAIDRGAKLLARGSSGTEIAPDGLVLLDDVQAGLLEARFEVRQTQGGLVLVGERTQGESRKLSAHSDARCQSPLLRQLHTMPQ